MKYSVKNRQLLDEAGKPVSFIRVKGKEVTTKEGKGFMVYKAVTDKQKFIDCKFTRTATAPMKDSFTIVNPRFNLDTNRLYPCVWIKGYDEIIDFVAVKDTLKTE